MAIKEYAAKLIEQDATLKEIAEQKETLWVNPKFLPFEMTDAVCQLVVSDADIADAEARLERFAPFIRKCFPETECTNGIIESPLKRVAVPVRLSLNQIGEANILCARTRPKLIGGERAKYTEED